MDVAQAASLATILPAVAVASTNSHVVGIIGADRISSHGEAGEEEGREGTREGHPRRAAVGAASTVSSNSIAQRKSMLTYCSDTVACE